MEEQIKKIYEKQKNGRIRMIRNVLLIYAALICVVSIFKGNPFPHQETVLFFDVKQPGWVTTDPWLLWICVVVDLIAGIFILIRDILRDFSKIDRILSQQCDAEKYSEMLEELIKYGKSLDYHGFQKSVMLIAESKYVVALIINGQLQKAEEYIKLPYYEVTRRFLLGVCYYRIGKEEQGKECMEYVIGHGNTLKCKEEAEKYVTV